MPELSQRLVGLLTDRVRNVRGKNSKGRNCRLELSADRARAEQSVCAARRSARVRDCPALRIAGRGSTLASGDCGLLAQREEEIAAAQAAEYQR